MSAAAPGAGPAGSARPPPARSRPPRGSIEARASAASFAAKPRADIAIGQRVFHTKFGYGAVAEIEGNKLEIDFEHAGRKRVLDSFVTPS